MTNVNVPPRVREALARAIERERREQARRQRASRVAERNRARQLERLRPRAGTILSWATALAASVSLPASGLRIQANAGGARARGIVVYRDGAVRFFQSAWGYGALHHDLGDVHWASGAAVIEDFAAAITSGEIWERVLRALD